MAELSKTAKASMGQQIAKPDPFDTDEKKIKKLLEMRNPELGLLFVGRMDFVDALIRVYRAQQKIIDALEHEIAAWEGRAEAGQQEHSEILREITR